MKVRIEDRNPDGRGRGHCGGRTALISGAHPGEEIVARVDRETRGTVQGRVSRILVADPRRVETPCPHAFHCTGCALLAAAPEDEESFKAGLIRAVLAGLDGGDLPEPDPVLTPTARFGHRHHAKQVFMLRRGRIVLGSYVSGTHRVVENTGCPVLVPELAAVMDAVALQAQAAGLAVAGKDAPGLRYAVARWGRVSRGAVVLLVTSDPDPRGAAGLAGRLHRSVRGVLGAHVLLNADSGNAILEGELVPVAGRMEVEEELLGYRHLIAPRAFFQVNPVAAERLFGLALEDAGEGSACVEGYAGVGALTLPLADRFRRVGAVESSGESVVALRAAVRNVRISDRVDVVEGDATQELPGMIDRLQPDAVVLDPPRRGIGVELAMSLGRARVPRVVLLSCAPESLGRDLPPLLAAGYRVRRVVPVDQFPRTAHVETVTRLDHEAGRGDA